VTEEQQIIADEILRIIGRVDAEKRRPTTYALQRFERAHWYPEALVLAMKENPAFAYDSSNGGEIDPNTPIEAIREFLERYIDIVEEKTGAPAIENELFSKRAATYYIVRKLNQRGIHATPRGVDFHLRDRGELQSKIVVGKAQLLTRKELDEFVDSYDKLPKRGRPAGTPVNE